MRVAMLVHNDVVSDARVRREASALADGGHEVLVVGLRDSGLPDEEELDGYSLRRVASATSAGWGSPLRKVAEQRERRTAFVRTALWFRPDVIHCHDADTLPAGLIVRERSNARLVYDAHELFEDMLAGHGFPWPVRRYWRNVEQKGAAAASAVITVNDARARILAERLGVEPVVVRSTPDVEPIAAEGDLRKLARVDRHTVIVLYQGHLLPNRGLETLVTAIASLSEDCVLVMQGGGPLEERIRARVAQLGLGDRVLLTGRVPPQDLHRYACDADIGVVIYEATSLNNLYAAPNKLYGYMMAGLPMVASDLPGLQDLFHKEDIGILFDTSSSDSIASAIRTLVQDPAARFRMGSNARRLAESRYNWAIDAQRLRNLYAKLEPVEA